MLRTFLLPFRVGVSNGPRKDSPFVGTKGKRAFSRGRRWESAPKMRASETGFPSLLRWTIAVEPPVRRFRPNSGRGDGGAPSCFCWLQTESFLHPRPLTTTPTGSGLPRHSRALTRSDSLSNSISKPLTLPSSSAARPSPSSASVAIRSSPRGPRASSPMPERPQVTRRPGTSRRGRASGPAKAVLRCRGTRRSKGRGALGTRLPLRRKSLTQPGGSPLPCTRPFRRVKGPKKYGGDAGLHALVTGTVTSRGGE